MIPKHHRLFTCGPNTGNDCPDGQERKNPIFQIETVGADTVDCDVWSRDARGHSSRHDAERALKSCRCVRCELVKVWRAIRRNQAAAESIQKRKAGKHRRRSNHK